MAALTTIVTFGFFAQNEERPTLAQFDEIELVELQRTAVDLALRDWIARIDGSAGGEFALGATVAANGTVGMNGSSTAATRFVARSADVSLPAQDSAPMIGSALAWRSPRAGFQARWRQNLTRGWDRPTDGTDVVVVDHVGDVAAYLCGAGSTAACEITTQFLLPGADEPPRLLEYGPVRDVIVDHPGVADSRGRFLALAVVRHEPRSATELADLVLLGQSNPDPAQVRDGGERVAAVTCTIATSPSRTPSTNRCSAQEIACSCSTAPRSAEACSWPSPVTLQEIRGSR